jgi:hypothetical protein
MGGLAAGLTHGARFVVLHAVGRIGSPGVRHDRHPSAGLPIGLTGLRDCWKYIALHMPAKWFRVAVIVQVVVSSSCTARQTFLIEMMYAWAAAEVPVKWFHLAAFGNFLC